MPIRSTTRWLLAAATLLVLAGATPADAADLARQQSDEQQQGDEQADRDARKEQKQRERQARIDAYLEAREKKRAEKAARKAEREQQNLAEEEQRRQREADEQQAKIAAEEQRRQREAEKQQAKIEAERQRRQQQDAAPTAKPRAAPRPAKPKAKAKPKPKAKPVRKGRAGSLAQVQRQLHASPLANDPAFKAYLELFDTGQATATQYATFGGLLARRGLFNESLAYYGRASRLDPLNSSIWLNQGTVHKQMGNNGAASEAFARAIAADPTNAMAHYNMGMTLYELGRYDDAIDELATALTLDPGLADPEQNPQVINNDLLLPVKMRLYELTSGAAGLPLVPVQENDEDR